MRCFCASRMRYKYISHDFRNKVTGIWETMQIKDEVHKEGNIEVL